MNYLKSFILLFVLFFSINTKAQTNISELKSDPVFIESLNEFYDLQYLICENFKFDSKSIRSVKSQIESLTESTLQTSESISAILKFNSVNDFDHIRESITRKWVLLQNKYGANFTIENINNAEKEFAPSLQGRSKIRYAICAAGAMAAGALAFTGCTGATVGIGAPACFALALLMQTAIIQDCAHDYLGD